MNNCELLVYARRYFGSDKEIEEFLEYISNAWDMMIDHKTCQILSKEGLIYDLEGKKIDVFLNSVNLFVTTMNMLKYISALYSYAKVVEKLGIVDEIKKAQSQEENKEIFKKVTDILRKAGKDL